MNSIRFNKNLSLNKETIAHLHSCNMKHAYGGTAAALAKEDVTECTNCTWTGDCCQTNTCEY